MGVYAMVNAQGVNEGNILWDGVSTWETPTGITLVQIDGISPMPGPGSTYSSGVWTAPSPPSGLPDPIGFETAIYADGTLTVARKAQLAPYFPVINAFISDTEQMLECWSGVITALSLTTEEQSIITGYASSFNIPGIS